VSTTMTVWRLSSPRQVNLDSKSPTAARVAAVGRTHFKTILALALGLRLGLVGVLLYRYPQPWVFTRTRDLAFLAQSLSSGRGLSSPFGGSTGATAFLAPGYPALVGLLFRLFGSYSLESALVLMVLQTLFAVLTVAAITHVARELFGSPVANLAGAFWAASPALVWLPVFAWETGLSTLLLIGMVLLALRCASKSSKGLWATVGACCGLAMLVNPSLMLALLGVVGWAAYQTRSVWRYEPLMGVFICVALFAPWPIRNALVLHAFIPLRSNFGYEVWQGNHAGGTGMFDSTLYPLNNRREYSDYAAKGELAYIREKSATAKNYIRANPDQFIKLIVKRVGLFWIGASEVNSRLLEWHAVATSLLGLLGLGALFAQKRATAMLLFLPLLVFPLPYYVTHPDFRFRIVLDPLLTILSAYAMVRFRAGNRTIERSANQHASQPGDDRRKHQLTDVIRSQEQGVAHDIGSDSQEE
jgi:Dolichyl-phosphate-mannose-protein mannosyltransferase